MDCIFCKMVSEEFPCHKIWENDKALAFLSIFPNTPGFSVVILKEHYPSYVFDLPDDAYRDLMFASKEVGKLLDAAFEDVGRTGILTEGFGVDHVHTKLFPMHGTAGEKEWRPRESSKNKFFEKYEGYISSHDCERADDAELEKLAKRIRGEDSEQGLDK